MNVFRQILILGSTFFLVACGGKGASPVDPSNSSTESMLPFELNKDNGAVAYYFAVHAYNFSVFGHVLPMNQPSLYKIVHENLTTIDLQRPECKTGGIVIVDNNPVTPTTIDNPNLFPNPYTYEITADNCDLLKEDDNMPMTFIDGFIHGTNNLTEKFNEYRVEFDRFAEDVTFERVPNPENYHEMDGSDKRGLLFDITGDYYSRSTYNQDRSLDSITNKVDKQEINHQKTGFWLKLNSYESKAIVKNGAFHRLTAHYHVKWQMVSPIDGEVVMLSAYEDLIGFLESPEKETFPPGEYNLKVEVDPGSPLTIKNGEAFPSGGHVIINLLSHNIKADVTYYPGYAEVTYTRNGRETRVRKDLLDIKSDATIF